MADAPSALSRRSVQSGRMLSARGWANARGTNSPDQITCAVASLRASAAPRRKARDSDVSVTI